MLCQFLLYNKVTICMCVCIHTHTHTCILFHLLFHDGLPQNIKYSPWGHVYFWILSEQDPFKFIFFQSNLFLLSHTQTVLGSLFLVYKSCFVHCTHFSLGNSYVFFKPFIPYSGLWLWDLKTLWLRSTAQLSSPKMADAIFFSQRIITKVSNRPKLKEFNSEYLLTPTSVSPMNISLHLLYLLSIHLPAPPSSN